MDMKTIKANLNDGWLIIGDTAKETPFLFYKPNAQDGEEQVPTQWVLELFEENFLTPDPDPGKLVCYHKK